MALTLASTNYSGTAAGAFMVKALLDNDAIRGGHLYVQDGIKHEYTISRLEVTDLVQDHAETPTTGGNAVVSGTKLAPKDYLLYLEFNPRIFEHHWFAEELPAALLDARLPATVESALVQEVLRQHAAYLGQALFAGELTGAAPFNKFDGLLTKLTATGSAANLLIDDALTAANIVEKLELCLDTLPTAVRAEAGLKFFVNHETAHIYRQAQMAQANKGIDFTDGGIMRFAGKQVVPVAGLPNSTILAAKGTADPSSNLWVGMNSRADENYVRVMPLANNSERWFLKMLMKVDVQVPFPEEVVIYQG